MSGVASVRYGDPVLDALIATIQQSVADNDSVITTLNNNQNALTTQVATLSPDNVIENGEFTAQAVLDLIKTIDGTGSGLDADSVGGQNLLAIQALIDARAAASHTHAAGDITGLPSGISFGGTQWTGYSQAPAAPGNAIVTGMQSVFDYGSGLANYRVSYRTFTQ
jgi:hypothetical protein